MLEKHRNSMAVIELSFWQGLYYLVLKVDRPNVKGVGKRLTPPNLRAQG
jgi:hypothetical protein